MQPLNRRLDQLFVLSRTFKAAHPCVKKQLIGLVYMGFLVPVLAPALTQVPPRRWSHRIRTSWFLEHD